MTPLTDDPDYFPDTNYERGYADGLAAARSRPATECNCGGHGGGWGKHAASCPAAPAATKSLARLRADAALLRLQDADAAR